MISPARRASTLPVERGSVGVRLPLALPGECVGVMGGSFNPPHAGHVTVARTAQRRLGLARVWWLVTPGNPLKSTGGLPPLAERMALCRALDPSPASVITGFEAELGTVYTAATLAFLRRRYPRVRFVWIMGADNLASFHRWQRWREIAAAMPIVVVDRPGWRWRALSSPAARALARVRLPESAAHHLARRTRGWTFLSTRLSPLSSTAIRAGRTHP